MVCIDLTARRRSQLGGDSSCCDVFITEVANVVELAARHDLNRHAWYTWPPSPIVPREPGDEFGCWREPDTLEDTEDFRFLDSQMQERHDRSSRSLQDDLQL